MDTTNTGNNANDTKALEQVSNDDQEKGAIALEREHHEKDLAEQCIISFKKELASNGGDYIHNHPFTKLLYQLTKHRLVEGRPFYNFQSHSRYAHPDGIVGVTYVGTNDCLVVSEVIKARPSLSEIQSYSLVTYRPVALLDIFNLTASFSNIGLGMSYLVMDQAHHAFGNSFTNQLTKAVVGQYPRVHGMSYRSAQWDTIESNPYNIVLFSAVGRRPQHVISSGEPERLDQVLLSNDMTVLEFATKRVR